jgi:hypothetical protein
LRRNLLACVASLVLVISGLGCLKMNSLVIVHSNGSISGTVTIGIMEDFFNMSEDTNISYGNMTLIDTENATVWSEDGWVYIQQEGMFVDEENMTVQVNSYPEHTEYVIDADLSEFQEEASQDDDFNLTDPFSQLFLQQMVFEFEVLMPGEIVEANTDDIDGSSATWSYNGVSIQDADRLYIKSRLPIPEGLIPISAIALAGLAYVIRSRED